jgi:hypothetical protein
MIGSAPPCSSNAPGSDQFVQHHRFALLVGKLDADHAASGDRRDACGQGRHIAGNVVGELDNPARLDAGGGLQLVHGDDRAGPDLDDRAFHVEVVEHAFQEPGVAL